MGIHIKARRTVRIKDMARGNTFMLMGVITMEIGVRIRCQGMEFCTTLMGKCSMMESGNRTVLKEGGSCMEESVIGINMRVSSRMERWMDLAQCVSMMGTYSLGITETTNQWGRGR